MALAASSASFHPAIDVDSFGSIDGKFMENVVRDADRYSDLKLELVCPECASAGLIPWQQLDHLLFCRGCSRTFRVEACGLVEVAAPTEERISVQVRTISSEWQAHQAVIHKSPGAARRLRGWAIDLATGPRVFRAAVCATIMVVGLSYALVARRPPPPPPVELPTLLDERAVLLADAVVRRDMAVLTALTDPTQHRALRIWLAHAEGLPRGVIGADAKVDAKLLSKAKTTAAGDNVDVRVQLRVPPDGRELVLVQRWVQQGETWRFRPVRLRSPQAPANVRATKQRRR